MAAQENMFEVLEREEAAPEVSQPADIITEGDQAAGLAKKGAVGATASPGGVAWVSPSEAPPTPGRAGLEAEPPLAEIAKEHPLPERGVQKHVHREPKAKAGSPKAKAQPPVKPDVSKAPGDISYAQAAKEGQEAAKERAAESAEAGKEAVGEAAKAAKARAGEARERAGEAGEELKQRAGEAGQAVAEKAGAAKERAAEAGAEVKRRAAEAAESAKHATEEARARAGELAGAARERAAEAAESAREGAHVVTEKVASAVEYIREHLPEVHLPEVHVERAETSPEERAQQELMDEAMALATGEPAPVRSPAPSVPRAEARAAQPLQVPPASEEPATARLAPTRGLAEAVEGERAAPTTTATGAPFHAYEPRTATEVMNAAEDKAARLAAEAREKAADLVGRASDAAPELPPGGARQAAREAAPDELAARAEREERSAKGPLEALADAVKGAAGYVKQHVLRAGEGGSPAGSPRRAAAPGPEIVVVEGRQGRRGAPHEWPALPGDLHPAQIAQAVRTARHGAAQHGQHAAQQAAGGAQHAERGGAPQERFALPGGLHPAQLARAVREKLALPESAPSPEEARDSTVGGMRAAGEEMEEAARAAADKASAATEQVKGAAGAVADKASGAVQQTREKVGAAYEEAKGAVAGTADKAGAKAQEAKERAGAAAEEAKGAAKERAGAARAEAESGAQATRERAGGVLDAARERLAGAAHAVGDTVQTAEDKAKWAYQHTKEELAAGPEHWREANVPHSQEEALKAAGIVPTDTESLLRAQGKAAPEAHAVREDEERAKLRTTEARGGSAGGSGIAPGYGGPGIDLRGAAHELRGAAHDVKEELKAELKDAVHDVDRKEPGQEGDIPS